MQATYRKEELFCPRALVCATVHGDLSWCGFCCATLPSPGKVILSR